MLLLLDPQPVWLPLAAELRAARITAAANQHSLAAGKLASAAARQPWNGDLAYQAGLAELASGQYGAARDHLLRAADQLNDRVEVRVALGDAYAGLGQLQPAMQEWQAAAAHLPDEEGLLFRLARGHVQLGLLKEAEAEYSRLAELRPDDVQLQYQFALLTAALDPHQALARLALVSGLSMDMAPTTDQLAASITTAIEAGDEAFVYGTVGYSMIQLGEWPLAAAALQNAIAIREDYSDAYAYLGLAADRQGGDGLEWYQRAIRVDPSSALAHTLLGLHWRLQGQDAQALPEFERAFELDPDNSGVAAELGGLAEAEGDYESAEGWFRKAVELAPKDGEFWLVLARFYVENEIKIDPSGLEAATRAATLAPENALALDTLGFALHLSGRPDEAEVRLNRALEINPRLASAVYHLGVVRLSQNRADEAQLLFRQAVGLDPDGPHGGLAYKALARLSP